ncbi:DddA-like double-stranded DNA deaminase toxin [Kribbella sp. NPDC058245]|uniref:DddA-like double-stranded DNA deaminase toxin n=1 Tax=Kribbella sp. NPDC058245 TaxID=3346399 RepID=UPI0036ECBC74
MPSDLQRVATGLVECLNGVPQILRYLEGLAGRCRENAALAAQSGATVPAQQLDHAARRCEEAAHYLSRAAPMGRAWAARAIGGSIEGGQHPGPGSAERNPLTGGAAQPTDDGHPAGREDSRPGVGRGGNGTRADERPDRDDVPDASDPARGPEGGGSPPDGPGPAEGGPDEPPIAPFIGRFFERLPERPDGLGPTSGFLTNIDGSKPIRLVSGTKGPGAGGPGLVGNYKQMRVAREHVEGHAAALMRRPGAAKEMTLYLNNKPCAGAMGCFATLPAQLPAGSKLSVYWPGGSKIFVGNGRGVE